MPCSAVCLQTIRADDSLIRIYSRVKIAGGLGVRPLEQWSTPSGKSAKLGLRDRFLTLPWPPSPIKNSGTQSMNYYTEQLLLNLHFLHLIFWILTSVISVIICNIFSDKIHKLRSSILSVIITSSPHPAFQTSWATRFPSCNNWWIFCILI